MSEQVLADVLQRRRFLPERRFIEVDTDPITLRSFNRLVVRRLLPLLLTFHSLLLSVIVVYSFKMFRAGRSLVFLLLSMFYRLLLSAIGVVCSFKRLFPAYVLLGRPKRLLPIFQMLLQRLLLHNKVGILQRSLSRLRCSLTLNRLLALLDASLLHAAVTVR